VAGSVIMPRRPKSASATWPGGVSPIRTVIRLGLRQFRFRPYPSGGEHDKTLGGEAETAEEETPQGHGRRRAGREGASGPGEGQQGIQPARWWDRDRESTRDAALREFRDETRLLATKAERACNHESESQSHRVVRARIRGCVELQRKEMSDKSGETLGSRRLGVGLVAPVVVCRGPG